MTCRTCRLPDSLDGAMMAFLWPPHGRATIKIVSHLADEGIAFENLANDDCIFVRVANAPRFLLGLGRMLTDLEQADTRILVTRTPQPGLKDFGDVRSVSDMISRLRGDWVVELLRDERYYSMVQPICRADDPTTVVGHEYLLRGVEPDGSTVPPNELFGAAEDPRVFFSLDQAARLNAVRTAARCNLPGDIFINLMPDAIYDPDSCLGSTIDAVAEAGIDPGRVVFEIVGSHRIEDLDLLRRIVGFFHSRGLRVALDDFGGRRTNLGTYMSLEPDYVKLDRSLTQNVQPSSARLEMVHSLVHNFHHAGVSMIAEGIESEEALAAVRSIGIEHVQGYLFGRPDHPAPLAA